MIKLPEHHKIWKWTVHNQWSINYYRFEFENFLLIFCFLLAYLFESFAAARKTTEAFKNGFLLREHNHNQKHLLNFIWKQIPMVLTDHFIVLIKSVGHTLTKFTNHEYHTKWIACLNYQYHQHQIVVMRMCLKFRRKENEIDTVILNQCLKFNTKLFQCEPVA